MPFPNDATTPLLPYRFWVNNDLDVVSANGTIRYHLSNCGSINPDIGDGSNYQQVCEHWDEPPTPNVLTNTRGSYVSSPGLIAGYTSLITQIESFRDLEDFSPLLMYISRGINLNEYTIKLRAVGVSINLFKSNWDDSGTNVAHAYIFDEQKTISQVELANGANGHFAEIRAGGEGKTITQQIIDDYFDPATGRAKFIFEATSASQENCASNAEHCYLELELSKNNDQTFEKIISRIYMDMHDVKDYYRHITAGSAEGAFVFNSFDAEHFGSISQAHPAKLNIYQGLVSSEKINSDFTLFVHGWRLRDSEKTSFAETSFKRMYWSGYQGWFGTLSWPTGWFNKPAYIYDARQAIFAAPNLPNYDRSEAVARRVGIDLANFLNNDENFKAISNRHVIAHSMGNVLVSEALRHYTSLGVPGTLFKTYVASEAAEVAGAYDYDKDQETIKHNFYELTDEICTPDLINNRFSPEAAWRCYNLHRGIEYDMPPDLYRQTLELVNNEGVNRLRHGPTSDAKTNNAINVAPAGSSYYSQLNQAVDSIINFYNTIDSALDVWGFNQLTKPDSFGVGGWIYTNEAIDMQIAYVKCKNDTTSENCAPPIFPDNVHARFIKDNTHELIWNQTLNADSSDILSFIVPGRTEPLGRDDVLTGAIELLEYTASNQDHSAQFHGYYSELRSDASFRARYWNNLLLETIGEFSIDTYSSLYNGFEVQLGNL